MNTVAPEPIPLGGATAAAEPAAEAGGSSPSIPESRRRLRSETVNIKLRLKDASGEEREHRLAVCLAVDEHYRLFEMNFVTRGKIGQGLDEMLRELGIQLSRAIQGRDPETGGPVV